MSFFRALFDLSFTEYVTTRLVRWGYLASVVVAAFGAVICVLVGLSQALAAESVLSGSSPVPDYALSRASNQRAIGIAMVIGGPVGFVSVTIFGRVLAEMTVVVFGIAESLRGRR